MSAPLRIKEAIVVEGRYDKAAVAAVADTLILETAGFGVFKDGERLALLRRLAAVRGLIILTDSDGAGFVIRNHLKGAIPGGQLKHAYIPDVAGKERRKRAPGKEGKLGVEGMKPDVLREAILRCGATVLDENAPDRPAGNLTPADLFALGLSGAAGRGGAAGGAPAAAGLARTHGRQGAAGGTQCAVHADGAGRGAQGEIK